MNEEERIKDHKRKSAAEDPACDFLRLLFLYKNKRYEDLITEFGQCESLTNETVILFALACMASGRIAFARGALAAVAESGDTDLFTQRYLEILRRDLPPQ